MWWGVTMTAELSDAYQTKREGVTQILGCVKEVFGDVLVYVLNTDAALESPEQGFEDAFGCCPQRIGLQQAGLSPNISKTASSSTSAAPAPALSQL